MININVMRFLLFLSIVFIFGCKSKAIVIAEAWHASNIGKKLQPGKCYISISYPEEFNQSEIKGKPFVLELHPTEFEHKKIYVRTEEFIFPDSKDTVFTLPIVPHYSRLVFNNDQFKNCTNSPKAAGFLFCLIEVPAIFKRISKRELEKSNYYISQKVVKRPSRITKRYVKKEPRKLWANEYFFEAGFSSELREAQANGKHNSYFVLIIQQKLIEQGYELKANNQFDDETKEALIDYQKKNGLRSGQLDFETLDKLGIDY